MFQILIYYLDYISQVVRNSCGVHEIGEIGFTGKKKRINDVVEDAYEIHVDGSFVEGEARLGKCYGDISKKRYSNVYL